MSLRNNHIKKLETISGWGLYPKVNVRIERPKTLADLRRLILTDSFIARGNGRSYGDSAINKLNTIDMTSFNRFLKFIPINQITDFFNNFK